MGNNKGLRNAAYICQRLSIVGGILWALNAIFFFVQYFSDGMKLPDFIISGIPLATLNREQVLGLVGAISRALAPGGMYIQFQYSLIDRKKIKSHFCRLTTVPVLLNFPPAVVYYAQK